jgi:hypothetical protein
MAKRKGPDGRQAAAEAAARLAKDYERWRDIYENGCMDPEWPDGVNIGLKRSHIIAGKKTLEGLLGDDWALYPDCYFFPEPPEMPNDFMAVCRPLPGSHRDVAGEMRTCGQWDGKAREVFHAYATPGKRPYCEIMRGKPLDEYLREIPGLV